MNDMGIMVDEQGQNLDVISEELLKTNRNLVATNTNMD
jgi:t-SNARE complex subunit (syntaxin)